MIMKCEVQPVMLDQLSEAIMASLSLEAPS